MEVAISMIPTKSQRVLYCSFVFLFFFQTQCGIRYVIRHWIPCEIYYSNIELPVCSPSTTIWKHCSRYLNALAKRRIYESFVFAMQPRWRSESSFRTNPRNRIKIDNFLFLLHSTSYLESCLEEQRSKIKVSNFLPYSAKLLHKYVIVEVN